MAIPDFTRADYTRPEPSGSALEGEVVGVPLRRSAGGLLPLAILYGAGAAIVSGIGYAVIGLSGFMVSIVAIGMGWLIAKAMMVASHGVGGRPFQIAAAVLTYFSVTLGQTLDIYWFHRAELVGASVSELFAIFSKYLLAGPFLRLQNNGISGAIGLLILFIGGPDGLAAGRRRGRPLPAHVAVRTALSAKKLAPSALVTRGTD